MYSGRLETADWLIFSGHICRAEVHVDLNSRVQSRDMGVHILSSSQVVIAVFERNSDS